MAWIWEVLELADARGRGTGRFRMITRSDEQPSEPPVDACACEAGHATREEARQCPDARARRESAMLAVGASYGAWDIARERRRQVEVEGYSAEHDHGHRDGALAIGAARILCDLAPPGEELGLGPGYAIVDDSLNRARDWLRPRLALYDLSGVDVLERIAERRRLAVSAGALCAAEVDRLDRLAVRVAVARRDGREDSA